LQRNKLLQLTQTVIVGRHVCVCALYVQ